MKWFRKDKTYLWVRSELEKPDPIADAMERITRHYRADRASFEAALCALSLSVSLSCSQPAQLCAALSHRYFVAKSHTLSCQR
jgi:hypothetical protein